MNQENMHINALADTYAMRFMGVCRVFSLTNEQKEVLFSDFSEEQARASGEILKLMNENLAMDGETTKMLRQQIQRMGAFSVESQRIISKMVELTDAFKTAKGISENRWMEDFHHWFYLIRSEDPYRGSYSNYLTRAVRGKPPAHEDIIERLDSLLLEISAKGGVILQETENFDRIFLVDEESGEILYPDVEEIHNAGENEPEPEGDDE